MSTDKPGEDILHAQEAGAGQSADANTAAGELEHTHNRFSYNPSLDGLRALSVAGVVIGHAGVARFAGFHGVTVFFVISGYLITSLLVQEVERTGRIGFATFYRRRFARLAPALVVIVVATSVWLLAIRLPLGQWWAGAVGSLTYTTDIIEAIWGNGSVSQYFQYTWSLGIEEQFYLIWPVALVLLFRSRSVTTVTALLIASIAAVWVLRAIQDFHTPTHELQFYGPLSHADSLMWGAVLAMVMTRFARARWMRIAAMIAGPLGVAGLVLVVINVHGLPLVHRVDQAGFGQTAMFAVACLAWVVTSPQGWFAKLMALRPLAFIGKLSYSIYLWNILLMWMFVTFVGLRPAATPLGLIFVVVLFGVSYASWRFVETPLRRRWASPRPHSIVG